MITLTNKEARHLILSNQGLLQNFFGNKKEGVLNVIRHLGYVQIDTIAVVERAHHHTLFSRVEDYKKSYLDELIEKDKTVFEYWSHAAAYLPMHDYRFSLIRKNLFASGRKKWFENKKATRFVYDRIKAEGPLQSKDFEEKKKQTGWWEWKESKRALEQLFMEGKLMVAKRQGFQKVYDITERVLPEGFNTETPNESEYAEYLILKSIRANGIVAKSEIGYLRSNTKAVAKVLNQLEKAGTVIPITVAGIQERLYSTTQNIERAAATQSKKKIKILSPFDNVAIQRTRLKRVFDFDYTIECYVPEAKRRYGYFCLPVLYGDSFIGRIDLKADRKEKALYVKNMFYESGIKQSKRLKDDLNKALKEFAQFNGCEKVAAFK